MRWVLPEIEKAQGKGWGGVRERGLKGGSCCVGGVLCSSRIERLA